MMQKIAPEKGLRQTTRGWGEALALPALPAHRRGPVWGAQRAGRYGHVPEQTPEGEIARLFRVWAHLEVTGELDTWREAIADDTVLAGGGARSGQPHSPAASYPHPGTPSPSSWPAPRRDPEIVISCQPSADEGLQLMRISLGGTTRAMRP